jgi:DNA-binding response OmpR family regulator
VENCPYIRKAIGGSLDNAGGTVVMAEDGEIGFKIFHEFKPNFFHLIITNLRMPKANGESLINSIRKYEKKNELKPTPILILSGKNGLF